jgi:hypothetical protein
MAAMLNLISMDSETEEKINDGRIRIESPLEFHFQTSESRDEFHLVDLSEYDGSGACFCENFRFRIEPKLKSGVIFPHEAGSQCKHIVMSRLILGDRLIKASIKTLTRQDAKEEASPTEDPS